MKFKYKMGDKVRIVKMRFDDEDRQEFVGMSGPITGQQFRSEGKAPNQTKVPVYVIDSVTTRWIFYEDELMPIWHLPEELFEL